MAAATEVAYARDCNMTVAVTSPKQRVRSGLCALLSAFDCVNTVLDVSSPFDAPELLRNAALDVVLVDSVAPDADLELLSELRSVSPAARVLILVDEADDDYQFQAVRAGARGFLSKDCSPEILQRALKSLLRGEMWIGDSVATRLIGKLLQCDAGEAADQPVLSPREQEILARLAEGYRNKEIASALAVSENTIRAHIASLYRKLQVSGRVEAALYYFGHGRQTGRSRSGLTSTFRPALDECGDPAVSPAPPAIHTVAAR